MGFLGFTLLPKSQRLASSREIQNTLRQGFVVRTPTVMAHVLIEPGTGIRFGYITGKRIGNAVTRNYAKRRFRAATVSLVGASVGQQAAIRVMWRLQPTSAVVPQKALLADIGRVWKKVKVRFEEN